MVLKLRVLAGSPAAQPAPPAERALEVDEHLAEIRFGRRAGLEVELPFAALAPIHARLVRRGAAWAVEDLGSEAGSWLDGTALEPGVARAVTPGAVIQVGHVSIVFEGPGPATRTGETTATIARRLVSDLFGARADGEVPRLVPIADWPAGQTPPPALRLVVSERPYLVGRGETCDLVLPTEDVSREHAVLLRRWAGVFIRDLDSKNGVRVAGRLIAGEHRVRDSDRIEIASFELRLDDPEDRYLSALEDSAPAPPPSPSPPSPPSPSSPSLAEPPAPELAPRSSRTARLAIAVASIVLLAIAALIVFLVVA